MAINPKDLTVDYKAIQAMPFRDRKALLYSGYADQVNAALTPSQRANLFPNYYAQSAAGAATSGATAGAGMSKADYLTRARNGGVSNSDYNRVSGRPEDKGPPKITASEFRAVESNPFLAGYADKTRRKEKTLPGGKFAANDKAGDKQRAVVREANRFGMDPLDLATVMSYESAGSYNPDRMGPKDQRKGASGAVAKGAQPNMMGLIQFGTFEQLEYGIKPGMTFDEQMVKVGDFLEKRGFKKWIEEHPDATIEQKRIALYSTINAGGPEEENWSKRDAWMGGAPGTVADKVGVMFQEGPAGKTHRGNAIALMEGSYGLADNNTAEQTTSPDAMAVVEKVASETPSAVELRTSAENLDINSTPESALAFLNNNERNPDGANLVDVDARLLELAEMGIRKFEAENPNLKVEIYGPSSGKRQSSVTKRSQHLIGKALDFEIFEVDPKTGQKTGKRLPNFRTQAGAGEAGDEYLKLHQNIELARIYKKEVIKDQRYEGVYGRSGALFGGDYALDTQHYDIGGAPAADGIMSASGPNTDQPGGSIFGGYSEEYMRRYGVESGAMPIEQDKVVQLAKSAYGPKETGPVVATATPSETTPSAVPAATVADNSAAATTPAATTATATATPNTPQATTASPAQGVSTSGVTTAASAPAPESTNYPIKTMAQGGIIPKSADTQIVQRNRSGDIISATKVGENENEKMSIEPISKMSADTLTVGSSNPVEENMINSKAQASPEDKKVSMKSQSVAQPRLSSDPYTNIQGDIKPMSPTAKAAMMAARDLSTERRGYSLKNV